MASQKKIQISIGFAILMIAIIWGSRILISNKFAAGKVNYPIDGDFTIQDMQIDGQNRPWIRTNNYEQGVPHPGIEYLEHGNWYSLDLSAIEISINEGWEFAIGPGSKVWALTKTGLYAYEAENWSKILSNSSLAHSIFQLEVDQSENIWIGYWGANPTGLKMFDGEQWLSFLDGYDIYEIQTAPNGQVWVGTKGGDIYVFEAGRLTKTYPSSTFKKPGDPGMFDSINDITFDSNGDAWISTGSRIVRGDEESWTIYESPSEFTDNVWVNGEILRGFTFPGYGNLAIDKMGQIWAITDSGLFLFNKEKWNQIYDEKGYDYSLLFLVQDRDGIIWTEDNDAIISFDPDSVNSSAPYVASFQRFFSGDGLFFVEGVLICLIVFTWLDALPAAAFAAAVSLVILFLSNVLVFPAHWEGEGVILSSWPIINPGAHVLIGGFIGALLGKFGSKSIKLQKRGGLGLAIIGSGIGLVLGLCQIYSIMILGALM